MPAADPYARLRESLGFEDPYARLRGTLGLEEDGPGPWEPTRSPHVQRRRRPDGSYETRATPPEEALRSKPIEPGNVDLATRPRVKNPDGSTSTVRSISVGTERGEVLLPTVSDDGRTLSDAEAVDLYRRTGRHLGIFSTPEEATAYAEELHGQEAAKLIPPNIASALKAAGKTAPDIGTVDVSDPKISGLARLVYGPNATEKGVARDKARVADAGFGWVVGGAERLGLVPEGTREELRTAAAETEEAYNLAHPAGGGPRIPFTESTVGDLARAVSEGGQTALAGVAGPQLLLGAGLGGAAARGAGALGAGRGLATLAGAAGGAAEAAGQTYLDVVDLPPEEQARQVLLGAGLGTLGGAMAGRAPRAPDAPEPRLTPEALPATGRNAPNYSEIIPGEKPANIIGLVSPPAPDAPFEAWLLREGWEPQDLTETQRGKLRQQFFRETDPAWAAQEAESAARVAAQQEERGQLLNLPEEPDLQPPARQEPTIPPEPPSPTGLEEIGPPRALDAPIEAVAKVPETEASIAPRMSTKALENVEGRKAEFHELVEQHRPEIEAARGPVKPASRWHDREGLARDLGMTTEDFLDSPAGRTWNDDEVSLGRHYLTGMRQEVGDLAGKLTRGEIPADQVEAAKARLAELEVDTVRMMATLQGSGFSTAARVMRSGQETLDPLGLASTPRAKLQLALLKHYGAKNAEEAAKIEQRAVARLKRQAAHEARKTGRAVTQEALSAEFQQLSSEFGKLSRTPRTGLDPELVALIGKMAANRVKAGVVAVEALADEIYQVARQHVEGIRREDVKAAIVEYTLAKPKARLARAEKAAAGSVEYLKGRVAGAPPAAGPTTSPWSARLGELKTRQAELREQLKRAPTERARKSEAAVSKAIERLEARAADLKAQIAKDPKEGLAARYRALLDDQTVELIAKLPADPSSPALLDFLRKMERPSFRDYRFTFWINSVLSGTKTAARNLSGNVVRLAELTGMRAPGAVVEAGVSRAQGRPAERVLRETLPATLAVFRGIPEGLKRFAFVVKEGYDPNRLVAELTEGGTDKFDQRLPVSPFLLSEKKGVRALGAAVTLPTRILEATDALFKTMAASSEHYAWATRKAVQENAPDVGARVADLLQEMPEEMLEAGKAFAKRATYQDPMSWVGSAAAAIRRGVPGARELAANLRSRGGAGNRAAAALVQGPETIGQHLLPFIHISDRVAAGLTDYIPGAKPFKLARLLAEKSPEASDLIARQVVGGALTMLGIGWAARGKLTGAAPKDEKLKNDFYAEGKQPYSLLVGGRWVPIRDTLGPLAGPFVAAAMYNDHVRVGEDPSAALTGMALGSSRYLLDASYMATLQQVIEAVDAEQGDVGRGLNQAGARVVGGYVPYSGLLRNVAQARDPRVVDKEGFLDELQAGIPGLREQLPARLDTDGDPLVMTTGAAGGVSPVVPTESKLADPALAEKVERLRYTLTSRRTELRHLEERLANARTLKDATRAREIMKQLPRGVTTADLDGTMKEIRALEQEIRALRKSKTPEERRKAIEIKKQQRMAQILEQALGRLGGGE